MNSLDAWAVPCAFILNSRHAALCGEAPCFGARAITVLVTHGLFSGTLWRKLRQQGVAHIYCTDTVPHAASVASERVTVLGAAGILVDYFKHAA